jgi:hypothetical protein
MILTVQKPCKTPINMLNFPMKRSPAITAIVLLLTLGVAGCAKSTQVTSSAAGHQINANIQGDHSIDSGTDHGVISSKFGKVVVEKERVQIDNGAWTEIPEGVPVGVKISKHDVLVTAGSVKIKRSVH